MKDFAIEWYKERAKQPKYQSQVNESNITDQINRAEYVEPSKFYSNPNVYKGKVGNVTQAAQVAMRQNKGAAIHIQCSFIPILWKIWRCVLA